MQYTKNVTDLVDFDNPDGEALPLIQCVCGERFTLWDFYLSVYDEGALLKSCPKCGAKLFFRNEIQIFQVVEVEDGNG